MTYRTTVPRTLASDVLMWEVDFSSRSVFESVTTARESYINIKCGIRAGISFVDLRIYEGRHHHDTTRTRAHHLESFLFDEIMTLRAAGVAWRGVAIAAFFLQATAVSCDLTVCLASRLSCSSRYVAT